MADEPLSRLFDLAEDDEALMTALLSAVDPSDVVRIAASHGVVLTDRDLRETVELDDAALGDVSGGTILHPTMSVFCGTNGSFCTFNPYACQSPG